jgi:hypothetical protein
MNKNLEALIERAGTWPEAVQDEAAHALAAIEQKHFGGKLSPEDEVKLAALRETIERSIQQGGSHTDEDIADFIERVHARAEQERR